MKRRNTNQKGRVQKKRRYSQKAKPNFPPGEMKYFDTAYGPTAITAVTTTWPSGTLANPTTINTLIAPTTGALLNNRIGREVKVCRIKINGTVYLNTQSSQSLATPAVKLRFLLVQDEQTNAAAMTSAALLSDASDVNNTIQTFQNSANFGRFRVLKDQFFILQNPALTGTAGSANIVQNGVKRPFKMTHTFKTPVSVRFNSTNGGTIADIVDNSFHVICAADGVADTPQLAYVCRVSYKE